jgi:hypothetical protein
VRLTVDDITQAHPGCAANDLGNLPLFANEEDGFVTKLKAVNTFEAAAELLNLPLVGPTGVRLFTGHCLRVSGAVHLAASGVDIWRIQALGRWGSEAVRLYLRDAHCNTLGAVALEAQMGRSLEQSSRAHGIASSCSADAPVIGHGVCFRVQRAVTDGGIGPSAYYVRPAGR